MSRDINTIPTVRRHIVSYQIHVEWNDSNKLVRLDHDMPSGLAHDLDNWFTDIEIEELDNE
jgi:hypothetical protein